MPVPLKERNNAQVNMQTVLFVGTSSLAYLDCTPQGDMRENIIYKIVQRKGNRFYGNGY